MKERALSTSDIDQLLSVPMEAKPGKFATVAEEVEFSLRLPVKAGLRVSLGLREASVTAVEVEISLANDSDNDIVFFPRGFLHNELVIWHDSFDDSERTGLPMLVSAENNGFVINKRSAIAKQIRILSDLCDSPTLKEDLFTPVGRIRPGRKSMALIARVDEEFFCVNSGKRFEDLEDFASTLGVTLWTGTATSNVVEFVL